jgi:hypothetical protein
MRWELELEEEEVTAANDGLEALAVAELREKDRVLSAVPTGTDREKRRPGAAGGWKRCEWQE